MRYCQIFIVGMFLIITALMFAPQNAFCGDNNIQWNYLYHNDPDNYDPTAEFVPFESFTFREVDPSGKVYPTTNVNIYILVDWGDLTSANVVYSTGGGDSWVSMSWVKNITTSFHGQASRTYDLWVGTIPAQPAGTTVWYRIQVNDGSASAYLKYGNSAGSGYHNPLGQWVRNPDAATSDNYSYQVEQPIPVELTAFAASIGDGFVTLNWTTQTETENYGFHVYRSEFIDRDYIKLTQTIIPGAGSSASVHHYSYVDSTVEISKTYYYKLKSLDYNGNEDFFGPIVATVTAVHSLPISKLPDAYALEQNYPNPFNPETAINFSIKEPGKISLKIYNLQGQLIRTLVAGNRTAGRYAVRWDGTTDQGITVSNGIYLYTLKVNGFADTKKLTFMK